MKTQSGDWSCIFNFLQASRFKSTSVMALSLLATARLMAQNQSPPAPAADASAAAPPPGTPTNDAGAMPPPTLQAPKPTKNEVSFSGDVMLGSGTVTLPLGYSLQKAVSSSPLGAFSVPRSSTYYGGTISYSYGQAWYLDLSYAQGQSSGSQSIDVGSLGSLPSTFSIDDTWYQIYIKYAFPQLRGKRLSAYLRVGASYVTAQIKDASTLPLSNNTYLQTDNTTDLLGNLGFGLGYSLYSTRHLRLGLQLEGEGFYGVRSQQSLESLSKDTGLNFVSAGIDNSLYGGIGRVTFRAEYRLGQSGLFKIFAEVGGEGRYTMITYPGASAPDELLWGPYAKLGIRYAF
jgi:hypothetical protein